MSRKTSSDIGLPSFDLKPQQKRLPLLRRLGNIIARMKHQGRDLQEYLDEPTIHLDEERKASMVDIISRLGTEESPLKQVTIITHDAEIFENAEVDSVYRFEATPEGTKVKLEA
jgi:ABC-type arginine transport system ATPase subunit